MKLVFQKSFNADMMALISFNKIQILEIFFSFDF